MIHNPQTLWIWHLDTDTWNYLLITAYDAIQLLRPDLVNRDQLRAIAEHFGVSPDVSELHATTLDYIIAATGS